MVYPLRHGRRHSGDRARGRNPQQSGSARSRRHLRPLQTACCGSAPNGQGSVSLNTDASGNGFSSSTPPRRTWSRALPAISTAVRSKSTTPGRAISLSRRQRHRQRPLTLHNKNGTMLVLAGRTRAAASLWPTTAANIFLAGADSSQNGGLLVNSRRHQSHLRRLRHSGNGGLHINSFTGKNLATLGADDANRRRWHLGPSGPRQRLRSSCACALLGNE